MHNIFFALEYHIIISLSTEDLLILPQLRFIHSSFQDKGVFFKEIFSAMELATVPRKKAAISMKQ